MEIIKVLLTSLLSVGVLFAVAKIMGHKQMSQLDFFDYISGITIGDGANQIDALSGATISSKAIASGVNAALACVENMG